MSLRLLMYTISNCLTTISSYLNYQVDQNEQIYKQIHKMLKAYVTLVQYKSVKECVIYSVALARLTALPAALPKSDST